MIKIILSLLLGYLIGAIPFGLIIGAIKGVDIRKTGSGNIGATNTLRALGKRAGLMVFLLDMLKGTAAVYIAMLLVPSQPQFLTKETYYILSGLAAIIGHMFSIYIDFKGGKGAATSLGILLGITPGLFLLALIYVIASIAITRIVSITSMTAGILLTILMFAFHEPIEYSIVTLIVAILMIYKHIPNIKRLQAGTEPRIWGHASRQAGAK